MGIFRFTPIIAFFFLALSGFGQLTPNTLLRSLNAEVTSVEVDQNRGLAYFAGEFSTYAGSRNGGEIFDENTMRPSYALPWVPYVHITVDDGEGGWIIATHYKDVWKAAHSLKPAITIRWQQQKISPACMAV